MSQTQIPKRDLIRAAIEKGGATRESLMEVAEVNKAGLASQLSYLNLIAKGAGTGFPLQDDKGIFYLGTQAEYDAKNQARASGKAPAVPKTAKERLEAAQKREDRASAKYTTCKKRMADEPSEVNALRLEIAERELRLASILLGQEQDGPVSNPNPEAYDGGIEPEDDDSEMI